MKCWKNFLSPHIQHPQNPTGNYTFVNKKILSNFFSFLWKKSLERKSESRLEYYILLFLWNVEKKQAGDNHLDPENFFGVKKVRLFWMRWWTFFMFWSRKSCAGKKVFSGDCPLLLGKLGWWAEDMFFMLIVWQPSERAGWMDFTRIDDDESREKE